MNAKQAIFDEIGDLFGDVKIKEEEVSNGENSAANSDLLLMEEEEGMKAVDESDETIEDNAIADYDDHGSKVEGKETSERVGPPDIFASIYETTVSTPPLNQEDREERKGTELTDDERDACIEAATDAITTTKMSPESLDWGLNFIQRMYDEKNAKIRARIDSIDWNAAKARWAEEDAEDSVREQEEKDRYLKS